MPLPNPSMKLAAMSLGAGSTMGSTSARRAALSQSAIRTTKTAAGSKAPSALARRTDRKLKPRVSFMKAPTSYDDDHATSAPRRSGGLCFLREEWNNEAPEGCHHFLRCVVVHVVAGGAG